MTAQNQPVYQHLKQRNATAVEAGNRWEDHPAGQQRRESGLAMICNLGGTK